MFGDKDQDQYENPVDLAVDAPDAEDYQPTVVEDYQPDPYTVDNQIYESQEQVTPAVDEDIRINTAYDPNDYYAQPEEYGADHPLFAGLEQPTEEAVAEETALVEDAPAETPIEDQPHAPVEERGLLGDIAVNLGRGIADTGELAGHALKVIGAEDSGQWLIDKSKDALNSETLAMDESEAKGEGSVKDGVMSGLRSTPASLAPMATGAAIGSVVPGVGTLAGGLIGSTLGAFGLFGLGVYGKTKEEATPKIGEEKANELGMLQAGVEAGIEAISTPIEAIIFAGTGGAGKAVTQPLKQTIKSLLSEGVQAAFKRYAKSSAVNVTTEQLQSGLGQYINNEYGVNEGSVLDAAIGATIPAMTTNFLLGIGMDTYTARQNHKMRQALSNGKADPKARVDSANAIYGKISQYDPELAEEWKNQAQYHINHGIGMPLDQDFEAFASAKVRSERDGSDVNANFKQITNENKQLLLEGPKGIAERAIDSMYRQEPNPTATNPPVNPPTQQLPPQQAQAQRKPSLLDITLGQPIPHDTSTIEGLLEEAKNLSPLQEEQKPIYEQMKKNIIAGRPLSRKQEMIWHSLVDVADANVEPFADTNIPYGAMVNPLGNAQIKQFSNNNGSKRVAVTRTTPEQSDILRAMGGRYNSKRASWILPEAKYQEVYDALLKVNNTNHIYPKNEFFVEPPSGNSAMPQQDTAQNVVSEQQAVAPVTEQEQINAEILQSDMQPFPSAPKEAVQPVTGESDLINQEDLPVQQAQQQDQVIPQEDIPFFDQIKPQTKKSTETIEKPKRKTKKQIREEKEQAEQLARQETDPNLGERIARTKADIDALVQKDVRQEQQTVAETKAEPKQAIDTNAQDANTNPTEAQKEAGNYKKGHITIGGLDISIENPSGSERSGKDQKGKAWSVKMNDHYGYIKGTVGKDKDHLDVFVRPGITEEEITKRPVFIINQRDPKTKDFDEHKIMLGYQYGATRPHYSGEPSAFMGYQSNYSKGWDGFGSIATMTFDEFKAWSTDGKPKNDPVYTYPSVGGLANLKEGDVLITPLGLETTPFPSLDFSDMNNPINGKRERSITTHRAVDNWVLENALAEAKSEGYQRNIDYYQGLLGSTGFSGSNIDIENAWEKITGNNPIRLKSKQEQVNTEQANEKGTSSAIREQLKKGYFIRWAKLDHRGNPDKSDWYEVMHYDKDGKPYVKAVSSGSRTIPLDWDNWFVVDVKTKFIHGKPIVKDGAIVAYEEEKKGGRYVTERPIAQKLRERGAKNIEDGNSQIDSAKDMEEGHDKRLKEYNGKSRVLEGHTLNNIAGAIERGELDKLRKFDKAWHQDLLEISLHRAKIDAVTESNTENSFDRAVVASDIAHAKLPSLTMQKDDLQRMADNLRGKKGKIRIGKSLDKIIKETTGDIVDLSSPERIELMKQADESLSTRIGFIGDNIRTREQYAELGITTDQELRDALEEYLLYRTDKPITEKPVAKPATSTNKMDDFGEKIGGAAKDLYADKLSQAKEKDIALVPLSVSFPTPKYDKLIEAGHDKEAVSLIRATRDSIPPKPRTSRGLNKWVEYVKITRDFAESLLSDPSLKGRIKEVLATGNDRISKIVLGRAELYDTLGHEYDFKDYTIAQRHYDQFGEEKNVTKWLIERVGKGHSSREDGNTKEEVIDKLRKKLEASKDTPKAPKETKFDLYRYRGDNKLFWIGKKVSGSKYIDLKSFANRVDAKAYLDNNQAELEKMLEDAKYTPEHRGNTNRERNGKDHREGVDISTEEFKGVFGFKGGEFGNTMKAKGERQAHINRAYDAFMDLAEVTGIPPEALSLNGTLSMAFGARGKGGKNPAAAHYEPSKVVINLTRKNGAGTLAHEWWHALDNYFGKQAKGEKYLSESYAAGEVRQEVLDAVAELRNAINQKTELKRRSERLDSSRSKDYWSTTREMTARVFESYVRHKMKEQGVHNDYLVNFREDDSFSKDLSKILFEGNINGAQASNDKYPYLKDSEVAPVAEALDKFFKTLKTKKTDQGTALYSKANTKGQAPSDLARELSGYMGERNFIKSANDGLVNIVATQAEAMRIIEGDGKERFSQKGETAISEETPRVLLALGLPDTGIKIPAAVIRKVTIGKHKEKHIGVDFKAVGESLYDPIAVFESESKPKSSVIVVTEVFDNNNERIIVPVEVSQKGGYNIVTSIHGRRTPEWFDTQIKRGRLVYLNKKKNQEGNEGRLHLPAPLNELSRLPERDSILGHVKNILTEDDIVNTDVRKYENGNIQGFTMPDGKVYLVADGITKGNASSVLKHELGVHARKLLLKDQTFNAILQSMESRAKVSDKVRAAWERVPSDTKAEHRNEEALSYLIEMHPEVGVVRQVIAKVKKILVDMGFDAKMFTEADLAGLAQIAVRRSDKGNINTKSDGEKFSFAGEGSQTALKHALDLAKKFKSKGDTNEQIFKATGWFEGRDGKWRYEIDDSQAVLRTDSLHYYKPTNGNIVTFRLGDVYQHDELYQAYPELEDRYLHVDHSENPKMGGLFSPSDGSVTVFINAHYTDEQLKSSVAHEIQHAIQRKEGFGHGTTADAVLEGLVDEFAGDLTKQQEAERSSIERLGDILDNNSRNKELRRLFYSYRKGDAHEKEVRDKIRTLHDGPELLNIVDELYAIDAVYEKQLEKFKSQAFDMYMDTVGEVEARDVEKRDWLLPRKKRRTLPDAAIGSDYVGRHKGAMFMANASGWARPISQHNDTKFSESNPDIRYSKSSVSPDTHNTDSVSSNPTDDTQTIRTGTYKTASGEVHIHVSNGLRSDIKDLLNRLKNSKDARIKDDLNFVEKGLSSFEYISEKSPATQRAFTAVTNRRDNAYEKENHILGDMVPNFEKAQKESPAEYTKANKYLLDTDKTGKGYSISTEPYYAVNDKDGNIVFEAKNNDDVLKKTNAYASKMEREGTPINRDDLKTVRETKARVFDRDNNEVGRFDNVPDAVTAMIDKESQYLREQGFGETSVGLVAQFRSMTNKAFDAMVEDMQKIINETFEAGLQEPTAEALDESKRWKLTKNGKDYFFETKAAAQSVGGANDTLVRQTDEQIKKEYTLTEMISKMGDMRGTYFPRQRYDGAVILRATKDGQPGYLQKFDMYALHRDKVTTDGEVIQQPATTFIKNLFNEVTAHIPFVETLEKEARRLKKEGYEISIERDTSAPESVFDAVKLVSSMNALLLDAKAKGAKGENGAAVAQAIGKAMTEQVANIFKQRGYLASRMSRSENYTVGYETDMLLAGTQYAKGLAAGIAKKQCAKEMVLAISGRDIPWKDWKADNPEGTWEQYEDFVDKRRLSPNEQPVLYGETMAWTGDQLRNDERVDRILSMVKSLAVIKFLGFRVSSAAVNATNMVQAVPATISDRAGVSIRDAMRHVKNGARAYYAYRRGNGSEADKEIFHKISERGWDEAKFNTDNAAVLQSKFGQAYNKFAELSMYAFSAVEKCNRAVTIYSAVKALQQQGVTDLNEALDRAKKISDRSHGLYGKATMPAWTRGAYNPLKLGFVFKKFSQNYLLNMVDMGYRGKTKQAAYMMLSPALIAGAGASLVTPILATAFGLTQDGDEDWQEEFYKWVDDIAGDHGERFARHGLAGLLFGVNLKGSLQMNVPMPTNAKEVGGAPLSMVLDVAKSMEHAGEGEYLKSAERLLPTGIATAIKAVREGTQGVTTGSYAPVYYGTEPLKSDGYDSALRFIGFNPSGISAKREEQWKESIVKTKMMERRKKINEQIRKTYLYQMGEPEEVIKSILHYNELAIGLGRPDIKPINPAQQIKSEIRRALRRSKLELSRQAQQ